jgi:hypothetical protein
MKTLLAILLSFLVSEAPVLAIHGGYTLGGATSVFGTYAGVMIPISDTSLVSGTSSTAFGTNSLGLFTLGIPNSGIGSGQVFIFSAGQQLAGTIQALPDPASTAGIVGVINATGSITFLTETTTTGSLTEGLITGEASGGLTATVSTSTVSYSTAGINITGTCNLTVTTETTTPTVTDAAGVTTGGDAEFIPTEAIVFAVDGFQQSNYAAPTTTTTTAQ